jgi:glycosyltransferase involved in cell wall biosynthesis
LSTHGGLLTMQHQAMRITHVFTHFSRLGGVETLLRRHLAHDGDFQLQSAIVAFFERDSRSDARVRGLGCSGWISTRSMRKRFRAAMVDRGASSLIYHNFWGATSTFDLDQSTRRLALLHSDLPGFHAQLLQQDRLFDGFMCVSQPLCDLVLGSNLGIESDRVILIPLPISSPIAGEAERSVPGNREVVRLGFCGRVVRPQKRVDRIPDFLRQLDQRLKHWELEILGDGPDLEWLRRRLATRPNVRFLGRQTGQSYWGVLRGWDAVVFFSDYEGLPLSLLEAMSVGCAAVFPRIGCGGDAYVGALDEGLLYEAGNLPTAVESTLRLVQLKRQGMQSIQRRARELARPHQGGGYHTVFDSFLRRIAGMPRHSKTNGSPPSCVLDLLPMGILHRVQRILRGHTPPGASSQVKPAKAQ